jgi:hypothetical protein
MEISPITGIRALPVMKTPSPDPELAAVFDISNYARIGDETYSPNGNRSSSGFEDEDSDFQDDQPSDQQLMESTMAVVESRFGRSISVFA